MLRPEHKVELYPVSVGTEAYSPFSFGTDMVKCENEDEFVQTLGRILSSDLPFAHFGSSFPRIGSLILKNKERPMLVLSYCGQLPIWQTKDLKIL